MTTASRTNKLDVVFGSFLDKQLESVVKGALGPAVDIAKALTLVTTLTTSLRSKVSSKLGVTGGVASGAFGGTAGSGTNLEIGVGVGSGFSVGVNVGTGFSAGLAGGSSGRIGGVPKGPISLGSSLGTRANKPTSSGGDINLGFSKGGFFGAGAKAGLVQTKDGIQPEMVTTVKEACWESFENSLTGEKYTEAEIREYKRTIRPGMDEAVQESFNRIFYPDLPYPNARGVQLISATVNMQTRGAWTALVEIDEDLEDDEPPTGPFIFNIDGVEFVGTVEPDYSGAWAGRRTIRVIGGAGNLTKKIEAKNYAGGLTRARNVIDDIIREIGETLSDECDKSILDVRMQGWQRFEGEAQSSLDLICSHIDAEWRVLRDGKIWIGQDQWPEVEPAGIIMGEYHEAGMTKVEMDYATLVPGVVVRGKKVEQVSYSLTRTGLEAECFAKSNTTLLSKFAQRVNKENDYVRRYRCKVVRQNADGTVDVITDDKRMKGRGIGKCRIRVGIPGSYVKVPPGARCLVGWDDGDPSLPYVSDWESSTGITSVQVGPKARGAAHVGSTVTHMFPRLMPFNGTYNGLPITGLVTIIENGIGIVQDGSPHLLV